MYTYTIEELITALETSIPLDKWKQAYCDIEEKRSMVDNFLVNGGHAYGFSTLFGHLDNNPMRKEDQDILVESHTIGTPQEYPPKLTRAISTIKMCQLSQGESGVSPHTYNEILSLYDRDIKANLDLDASYGSGDVVPSAWWLKSLFPEKNFIYPGDVMALINGSFIPVGILLFYRKKIHTIFKSSIELVRKSSKTVSNSSVQLPVSLRDISPLSHLIDSVLHDIDTQIERSSSFSSGNPIFHFDKEEVKPLSNSSFLNFDLSLSLRKLSECINILSSYLRSSTLYSSSYAESVAHNAQEKTHFIQHPKVSKAYCDKISSILNFSPSYSQGESHHVEDISDGSLMLVASIVDSLDLLNKQVNILREVQLGLEKH